MFLILICLAGLRVPLIVCTVHNWRRVLTHACWYAAKKSDDWSVQGPVSRLEKLVNIVRGSIGQLFMRLQRSQNVNFHSGDWLPSNLAKKINASDIDVVNLHWVAGETMSIEDIGRIKKPIVWTMHDMWPFCGAEHVTDYTPRS